MRTLAGFLKRTEGCGLETKVCLMQMLVDHDEKAGKMYSDVFRTLADKPLKRQLADQKFGRFLVFSDLTKGNSAWTKSMGLFDTDGGLLLQGEIGCYKSMCEKQET
jgi:hypothetical protein